MITIIVHHLLRSFWSSQQLSGFSHGFNRLCHTLIIVQSTPNTSTYISLCIMNNELIKHKPAVLLCLLLLWKTPSFPLFLTFRLRQLDTILQWGGAQLFNINNSAEEITTQQLQWSHKDSEEQEDWQPETCPEKNKTKPRNWSVGCCCCCSSSMRGNHLNKDHLTPTNRHRHSCARAGLCSSYYQNSYLFIL